MFSQLFKKKELAYQNVRADQFAELIEKEDHIVLDVRMPQEKAEGTVPGNLLINFFDSDFSSRVSKLDPSKTYLIYCRSGNRSSQACTLMASMGFEKLYNLQGGIGAWKAYENSK